MAQPGSLPCPSGYILDKTWFTSCFEMSDWEIYKVNSYCYLICVPDTSTLLVVSKIEWKGTLEKGHWTAYYAHLLHEDRGREVYEFARSDPETYVTTALI